MDFTKLPGKVPKWGLYAGAGVVAGGIMLVVSKKKAASGATTGMAQTADVQGTPTTSPPGAGLVVPQVTVVPSDNTDQGLLSQGLGSLQELYMNGTQSLLQSFQGVLDPVLGQNLTITQSLLDQNASISQGLFGLSSQMSSQQADMLTTMAAGPPPAPAAQAPIVVFAPVPAAVPQAAPVPTAPSNPCSGTYPHLNETNGQCYTVGCCGGKRCHIYKNGTKTVVTGACP